MEDATRLEEVLSAFAMLPDADVRLVIMNCVGVQIDMRWTWETVDCAEEIIESDPLIGARFEVEYQDQRIKIANSEEAILLEEEGYTPLDIDDLEKIVASRGEALPPVFEFPTPEYVLESRRGKSGELIPAFLYIV
ncbi:MAG: hypothetical protein HYS59_00565 [Candidatus Vogelbacteria bacterium]|nr:hypothetical protein [Candidatus Vogelbacteria bacterium]